MTSLESKNMNLKLNATDNGEPIIAVNQGSYELIFLVYVRA